MQNVRRVPTFVLLLALCFVVLWGGTVLAAGETLTRAATTVAGGQAVINGVEVHSAVGQPVAGSVSGSSGELCSGLLCPGSAVAQATPATPVASPSPQTTTTPASTPQATTTPASTPFPNSGANLFMPLLSR